MNSGKALNEITDGTQFKSLPLTAAHNLADLFTLHAHKSLGEI
jgi:hypothetical protein